MRLTARSRVSLVTVAATSFCCAALVTAIIGARQTIGATPQGRIWLVLIVLAGLIALGLLGWANDERRTVRLGIGWAVLGIAIGAVALRQSPGAVPGVPLSAGWSVLVLAGTAALVGGVLLAVRPWVRSQARRPFVPLVVIGVYAVQVAGYWGAVTWTDGQNVRLSVADAGPLSPRTAVLDGRALWSAQTAGQVVGSAGGLLVTLDNGVRMVDPRTGATRWTYQRADVTAVVAPVASPDGKLVAVEAGSPSALDNNGVNHVRLLVFEATRGAVLLDTPLATNVEGGLSGLSDDVAYFAGGPSSSDTVQLTAVDTTGPSAGRPRWLFYPRDGCQINRFSGPGGATGDGLVLSTSCGSVVLLGPDGKARWTYRVPAGGAEVWPLVGSPADTVLVAVQAPAGPAYPGFGAPVPRGVVALDARTGSVRWADTHLPPPPYAANSQDLADGSTTARWAGNTALLAYYLPNAHEVWLVGINPGNRSSWAVTVPGMNFAIQVPQTIGDYLAVLPDGRILLPSRSTNATADVVAEPRVTVVDGRTGAARASIAVEGVDRSTGYLGPPAAVGTPAGVVLDISGPIWPDGSPNSLLIGLR